MPANNPIIKTFTSMAPNYEKIVDSELNHFWGWSYTGFVDKLLEITPLNHNDIVLDIATGTGVIPERLVASGLNGHKLFGLDITLAMLKHAQTRFSERNIRDKVALACATAMRMPYADDSFSLVLCGLATHHMDVKRLLYESHRILQRDGRISIIDAGGTPFWNVPGFRILLRLAAFAYFSISEGGQRAWAESSAVSNVRTKEGWNSLLLASGFKNIKVHTMKTKFSWISAPLIIQAAKA